MLQLLMYGQPYIVKLQLEMPESSVNQRLGSVIFVALASDLVKSVGLLLHLMC